MVLLVIILIYLGLPRNFEIILRPNKGVLAISIGAYKLCWAYTYEIGIIEVMYLINANISSLIIKLL